MSGIFIGHSHPRPCSGEKTLRRCRNSEASDNVILIDVDTDSFDNVVIIDVPESLSKKKTQNSNMHRKDKKWSFRNIIYIDDEENPDPDHSFGVNNATSQYVQEIATPVGLSKCKSTNSGKGSQRNHYGLNSDSESDSSDDDCPDCELVVDSSGKVQEQWEKAFSRRKKDFRNSHFLDIRDHDSTLRVVDEMGYATRQSKEASISFSTGKFDYEKDDSSCFRTKEDTRAFDFSVDNSECEPGSSNRHTEENNVSSAFLKESDKEFDHTTPVFEGSSKVEPCPPKYKSRADEDWCSGESSPLEDETTVRTSKVPFETEVNSSRSFSEDKCKNFPETDTGNAQEMEHSESRQSHATGKSSSCNSSGNTLREGKSVSDIQQEENEDGQTQLHSENGETSSVEICIINEREKLKETEEYKRAMEEEWASRQEALRVQAEEAQHLRQLQKRRNLESLRLSDMEKRQKQRIEEVRNMQKKDEENMNLKESIRAEVRDDLKNLEGSCHSMASLLHLLGIHVGGWPYPLPKEVQTAYKRALLTFHPDRASQSDIRQQVEAEEKFKLINRLKGKFAPL